MVSSDVLLFSEYSSGYDFRLFHEKSHHLHYSKINKSKFNEILVQYRNHLLLDLDLYFHCFAFKFNDINILKFA